MIVESERDRAGVVAVGRLVRRTLDAMKAAVRAGITTAELDAIAAELCGREGARSAPRLVYDFPGFTCICVNDEIVHGIPSTRALREGDLVTLDVTLELDGYMADAAETLPVGEVSAEARALVECAERAFARGVREARAGRRPLDVGREVEDEVNARGFAVVRELQGHGIGRRIHESPGMPNWPDPAAREWLLEGTVLTVEPIIAAGSGRAVEAGDGWTIRTADGRLAAHHEHTLLVGKGRPLLLTAAE